jgi:predicted acylesterase/phospholipase RssA
LTNPIDYTQALVLSGGGAYGAYEVGVMKALFTGESPATGHIPLNPGVLTGTSVGAVNASVIVSHPEVDICSIGSLLENVWVDVISDGRQGCGNRVFRFRADLLKYFDPKCVLPSPMQPLREFAGDCVFFANDWFKRGINFLMSNANLEERAVQLFDLSSFISGAPFLALLRKIVSVEDIRRSERVLIVLATNWETGELRVFGNKDLTDELGYDVILGSAAIPGFFAPHCVAGERYADGGLLMNTPLQSAIQAGAETLHVIYMDPDVKNIPMATLTSTIDTFDKVLVITSANRTNEDIETAAWINEGLDVLERAARGEPLSNPGVLAFLRVAAQIESHIREGAPYKKLTIHRYHPHDDLGGGALGLLNFDRNRMIALIERGLNDAINHDCRESHCVLPVDGLGH